MSQVKKIEALGESLILIGDLNAHVGDLVPNNKEKVSHGGQLLRDFVQNSDYVLVNSTEKTVSGPFTRVDPADPNKLSALDLCIVSQELLYYVDSLIIDKNRNFTPYRPIWRRKMVYTDHYSLLLTLKDCPLVNDSRNSQGGAIVRWNTNRVGGWQTYKELTSNNMVLDEVADTSNGDPEKLMKKLDKEITRIKHVAFGKVKVRNKPKSAKELDELHKEKQAIWDNSLDTSMKMD